MYKTCNDEFLLELLGKSDENAFAEIYRRYWEQIFFIAHKRLSSAEDAKEIMQTVFFSLWQKREKLQIENLTFYLSAMTRYAVYRYLSNEKRRDNLVKNFGQYHARKSVLSIDFDNKDMLEILARFTNNLPEKYKLVFLHHKLLDRPIEEVAEKLGVSPRTAEAYVSKVMEMMRKYRRSLLADTFLL
jgi:RNA polymerase sigma factor (sigma-70 family)